MMVLIIAVAMILAVGGLYFSGRSALRFSLGLTIAIFTVGLMVPVFRWDVISVWLRFAFPIIAALMTIYVLAVRGQSFVASWRKSGFALRALIVAAPLVSVWLTFGIWTATDPDTEQLHLEWPLQNGRYYVAHGGNSEVFNHHFEVPAQKFALDITAIDDLGRRASRLSPSSLEDYLIFDTKVLSPCEGVVLAAEPATEDRTQIAYAAGGFVAIDCGAQTVLLAHLRGAPSVSAGHRVTAGEPLGKVGNTGNSSEPHLHIHAVAGRVEDLKVLLFEGTGVPLSFDGRFLWRNDTVVRPQ